MPFWTSALHAASDRRLEEAFRSSSGRGWRPAGRLDAEGVESTYGMADAEAGMTSPTRPIVRKVMARARLLLDACLSAGRALLIPPY